MTLQERLIKYMTDNDLSVITTAKLLGIGPTPVTLIKLKNKYTPATAEKIYNALGPDYLEYVEYSVCECCGTKYIPCSTLQKTCENTDLTGRNEIEKLPWKPKEGDFYHCVLHNGTVDFHRWSSKWYDYYCYNSGNCFKTRREITGEIKQRILSEMKGKYEND